VTVSVHILTKSAAFVWVGTATVACVSHDMTLQSPLVSECMESAAR